MPLSRHFVLLLVEFVGRNTNHRILIKLLKVVNRLIGKDVSVRNKEDSRLLTVLPFVPIGLEEFPTYLESDVGLTCTGSHRE